MTYMELQRPDANGFHVINSPNHRMGSANSFLSSVPMYIQCPWNEITTRLSRTLRSYTMTPISAPSLVLVSFRPGFVLARATIPTITTEPFIISAFNLGSGYTQ